MPRKSAGAQTAETLRSAVDRTVQATVGQAQITRDRAQELVDELAGTASRVREALDDLRPASGEDVESLGARLEALERRVASLEHAKGSTATGAATKGTSGKGTSGEGTSGKSASGKATAAKGAATKGRAKR